MSKKPEVPQAVADSVEPQEEERYMTIHCVWPVKVNGKEYFGMVTVPHELGETIAEMLNKKNRAETMIHIGKEYEYQRLVDGSKAVVDAHTKRRV
jgi:hypothetical protein